jgi:hypothetical protein
MLDRPSPCGGEVDRVVRLVAEAPNRGFAGGWHDDSDCAQRFASVVALV